MQLTPAAILIAPFDVEMARSIVETARDYLGANVRGVRIRIAGVRGMMFGSVALSDGDPLAGIGSFVWMLENIALGKALAKALHVSTIVVINERRSDWEQSTSFDRNGRSFVSSRSLEQSAAAFANGGLDPRDAANGLPLGVQAAITGLRRHHLEDLIDAPGVTCDLDTIPDDLVSQLEATLGDVPAEISEVPRAIELDMPIAIHDELAIVARKLRAKPFDTIEAVWRLAITAGLYDLPDASGVRLRPYSRFARPKLDRLRAIWSALPPLADSERGRVTVEMPERVIAEVHEIAAHVDHTASWAFERAYRLARERG